MCKTNFHMDGDGDDDDMGEQWNMFVIVILVTHSCDKRLLVFDKTYTKLIFTSEIY